MQQPQKRRTPTPFSVERRANQAEVARAQHAARRGYDIRPDRRDDYRRAYHRLLRLGMARGDILQSLKPDFEEVTP